MHEHDEQIIFEMGYNIGFKVGIKGSIPKADYENRLKAEKIAMLKELKSEFEKYEPKWAENEDQVIASNRTWDDFDDIIQQKINALRGSEYAR